MEMKSIVIVVLILLLVFAAVQAYQISGLKDKVTGSGSTGSLSAPLAGNNAPAPSSAPASSGMVGGC